MNAEGGSLRLVKTKKLKEIKLFQLIGFCEKEEELGTLKEEREAVLCRK